MDVMAVTIRDVARAAGVSASTVTRALTMPELVSSDTRERVRRTAATLGYHPNKAARGLSTGRTGNLGLLVPDLGNPFFPSMVKGVQARAHEADYAVFLADSDEDAAAEVSLVRKLAAQVDGLVLCSPRMPDDELRAAGKDVPIVLVNRRLARMPSVTADFQDGLRQAVSHLHALGHRRIAYVAGPRTAWANKERLRALRAVAVERGTELVEIGNVTPQFEGGVAAADQVLVSAATAVIAYNDLVALGLLNRFTARGVRVPDELSLIGFDDIDVATMVHPALTTVALPKEQAGRAGVDLLLQLLATPGQATRLATAGNTIATRPAAAGDATATATQPTPPGSATATRPATSGNATATPPALPGNATATRPTTPGRAIATRRELPCQLMVRGSTGPAYGRD